MPKPTDLDRALAFVIGRIEAEAQLTGGPLTEEQRSLLSNLPTAPSFPITIVSETELPLPMGVPRDLAYERLIALAREARRSDGRLDPAGDQKWKWAFAALKLHGHPMSWLLDWAGMKQERPWWDRPLLVVSSLLLTLCGSALVVLGTGSAGPGFLWVVVGTGFAAILCLLYFLTRLVQVWQLKQAIEKYR